MAMTKAQLEEIITAMTSVAQIVASYRKTLVAAGVPEEDATRLALEMQNSMMNQGKQSDNENPIVKAFGLNN